jgi:hypothetical protein
VLESTVAAHRAGIYQARSAAISKLATIAAHIVGCLAEIGNSRVEMMADENQD